MYLLAKYVIVVVVNRQSRLGIKPPEGDMNVEGLLLGGLVISLHIAFHTNAINFLEREIAAIEIFYLYQSPESDSYLWNKF